jgi:ribosomal protein S18 acetylase RimI-like enzyme
MKSSVRIRLMRLSDYPQIHALWLKSEGVGVGESDSREAVGRFLKRNPGLSLTATSGKRVVAAVLCGHDGRRGYLHHLAVSGRWRRRGIGRELVTGCLERLRAQDIPKCNLFLFSSNKSGRDFWRRLGWKVRADLRLVQRGTDDSRGSCSTSC